MSINLESANFQHRTACPSCGSRNFSLALKGTAEDFGSLAELKEAFSGLSTWTSHFSYAHCSECDLLFSERYPNDGLLKELYSDVAINTVGQDTNALIATHEWLVEKRVRPVFARVSERAKGLEIGPDVGHFAKILIDEFDGFTMDFVEPNKSAWSLLRRNIGEDIDIYLTLDELPASSTYGLVVAHHVFDHIPNLAHLMNKINAVTVPGSALSIVVHNHRSLLRTLMGSRWPPFCLQHPQLFSEKAVSRLLEHHGWKLQGCKRQTNYVGVLATAINLCSLFGFKRRDLPPRDLVIPIPLGNLSAIAHRIR